MSTPTKLISYEDSLLMPENKLEEIVHGESRIMPSSTWEHVHLSEVLAESLREQLPAGLYYVTSSGAGLGIERDPLTYRIPDLLVFRKEAVRQGRIRSGKRDPYIWAVPELLVECLSPSNRKGSIMELLADYERIGVPEAWLLDPEQPRFTSYFYDSGALREHQQLSRGIVSPRFLPGVSVDLADLWAAFEEE